MRAVQPDPPKGTSGGIRPSETSPSGTSFSRTTADLGNFHGGSGHGAGLARVAGGSDDRAFEHEPSVVFGLKS